MSAQIVPQSTTPAARLHYLDWLRVIAILMVFLFHAVHLFDFGGWQIKNAEQSEIITIILTILSLWGMPFFFLVAGTASWFALQRRTESQYVSERFKRLLVPFIFGSLLFSPIQYYLEWANRIQLGIVTVPFNTFLGYELPLFDPLSLRFPGWSSRWFGALGFHLWFVGFLFSFALMTLPLFRWLKSETGKRFVSWLGEMCEHRGGILAFVLPLLIVQFCLRPFFTMEHEWADFGFQMSFFILGYLLFADERIARAVRRDWWILLTVGTVILAGLLGAYLTGMPMITWGNDPSFVPQYYLILPLITIIAFCYTLTMFFVGMRFLDFTNKWLVYGQEAALPFFVLHQPTIVVIAFFVVQWNMSLALKLLIVVTSSFIVALGLYELVIKRIGFLRTLFGMTTGHVETRKRSSQPAHTGKVG